MGLLSHRRPKGRRIALAADGGGHTVVASDLVIAEGLELPELSDRPGRSSPRRSRPTATLVNPVDFAGGGEQDIRSFERVIARAPPLGRGRHRHPHRLLRRLLAVLGRVRGAGERVCRGHGPRGRGDRRPVPRAHDVLEVGARRDAARERRPGLPGGRGRGRCRLAARAAHARGAAGRAGDPRAGRPGHRATGLLRLARAARRGRRSFRRGAAGDRRGRGARRGGRDRLPGRPQGARPAAQVGLGRSRRRPGRSRGATRTPSSRWSLRSRPRRTRWR